MSCVYDVCIIGSGAGGGAVAYSLSLAGYSVVILEKGGYFREADFDKDEIAVCRREKFTPNLDDEQHVIYEKNNDEMTRYIGSESGWSFWNGSLVGGSSNLMSGFFHRLKPNDFKLQSTYGNIKGANIINWAISYDELEPYYTKVESLIGVSGIVSKHPFLEPRSTQTFPYPPLAENETTKWFDGACKDLGYASIATPRAILSQNIPSRNSCYYSNFCGSYPCASGAKGSSRAALLQSNQQIHIIPNAFVYKLTSTKNSVQEAHYYDKSKKSHIIKATIFVVAAQAIETCRLLLNSKNTFFPNGLANNNNQVGKNLIFSAGGVGQGSFNLAKYSPDDQKKIMQEGVFFNRSLQDWYEFQDNNTLYKGGTVDFLFEHANLIPRLTKYIYDKDGNFTFGKKLQEQIFQNLNNHKVLTFEVFNDWLPTDGCYIGIDNEIKDKYGVPVASIYLNSHPHDLFVGEFLAKKSIKVLEKMGLENISYDISSSPPPNLVAGGCRFSDDPKTSVLDRNCKAHELQNLYVSDASFMPTGGSVPYTWTIYANAFRVADAIIASLK